MLGSSFSPQRKKFFTIIEGNIYHKVNGKKRRPWLNSKTSFSVNIKTTNLCLMIERLKIKNITNEVFETNYIKMSISIKYTSLI